MEIIGNVKSPSFGYAAVALSRRRRVYQQRNSVEAFSSAVATEMERVHPDAGRSTRKLFFLRNCFHFFIIIFQKTKLYGGA